MPTWGARKKAELELWCRNWSCSKVRLHTHTNCSPWLGSTKLHDLLLGPCSLKLCPFPLFKHISKFSFKEPFLIDPHFILIIWFCIVICLLNWLPCALFVYSCLFPWFSGHFLSLPHCMETFSKSAFFPSLTSFIYPSNKLYACFTPGTLLDTGSDAKWIWHELFL